MDLNNRVINIAYIILKNKATVREVAKMIGISKSTVHKDLTERLKSVDYNLYKSVKNLLEYNKSVRHIRGGAKTKLKYSKYLDHKV